ncbi:hypothetical protein QJS10_CPB11g02245 [Acorus calamus]|uniref:Plant heme peroxidase family profile domain-containing protein n=1 Tax=Acorus calamus TaxID=4465 RepID=A0AAV9DYH4_ACOCL|nr:hypothetical protein QJS10_CPB11g02245 [Acorus calamus]
MEGKANLRFLIASMLILSMSIVPCHAQLSPTFYDSTCPNALSTIRAAVWKAVWEERRMAASLIRLHFHDCFVQVGGPTWTVKLGRRDSTSAAGKDEVESNLPKFTDGLDNLTTLFANKGLNSRDMVALSGSHTIGQAKCATYRGRIYNVTDIDIDTSFASTRRRGCPSVGSDGNLAPLDLVA